ncbi:MAG: segregation and condensation protein A [Candidatus Kapaibacterium sp.]|jgi:segregation and condensation protein A
MAINIQLQLLLCYLNSKTMDYTIRLPNFEGPFDLLLYFIQRDELNIYDIPIAKITSDFLEYLRFIQLFDLELAGEFLVMASTLMQIKTLMLLPRPITEQTSEDEADPRTALVQKLLQYKQIKEAAIHLSGKADEQRYTYYRSIFEAERDALPYNDSLKNATLFDLMRALRKALARAPKEPKAHVMQKRPVTVEEKASLILDLLKQTKELSFLRMTTTDTKQHIVATFLAILDMVKNRLISIVQADNEDDIIITERIEEQQTVEFSLN